jgi:hypothetical protein
VSSKLVNRRGAEIYINHGKLHILIINGFF